jgi:NAD(P)-dependent dehydrogenase (short-subunit alcohol dehydrogenase family)
MDVPGSLQGRTAVITGAGRNIGRAIALELGRLGANVIVNARSNEAEAADVCAAIRAAGAEAHPVLADVARIADVDRLFAEARSTFGPVSILVNNAAVRPSQSFLDITEQDWDWVVNTGLKGAFFCAQQASRDMVGLGHGRIINISGKDGFVGRASRAHGVTVKAGLHGLTKALAIELGPFGITANTVVPGGIDTTRPAAWYPDWNPAERAARNPVRRLGTPDDIARTCGFLATDAGYITGTAIHVNGGDAVV